MAVINAVGNALTGLTGTGTFVGSTSPTITTPVIAQVNDVNGNAVFGLTPVASAVNYVVTQNAATLGFPAVTVAGSDPNIGINVVSKATGLVQLASTAASPVAILSGTTYQHSTTLAFANTSASRIVTFPDRALTVSGTVQQIVSTTLTTSFSASSTGSTWVDITGLSQAITPGSSSNTVLVRVVISGAGGTVTNGVYFQIVRTSTAVGVGTSVGSKTAVGGGMLVSQLFAMGSCVLEFLDSPATTSATTYKIQFANVNSAGAITCYVNRSVTDTDLAVFPRGVSTITLTEIQP